ncbi:hypothetical protein L7F22_064680 [Adiantum nelumboides]|nr:hypothetical protein [Adiantum nelumboides]
MQRAMELIEQSTQIMLQILLTRAAQEEAPVKEPERLVQVQINSEDEEEEDKEDENENEEEGDDDEDDDDDEDGFPDRYEKQIQACIAETKTQAMQDAKLWHARFGHVGYGSLMTLRHNMVHDLSLLEMPLRHVCEGCVLGKMHKFAFSQDGSVRATRKLQLVHSDVCGPVRTPSVGNSLYFVTFIDDFSRFCWVAKYRLFVPIEEVNTCQTQDVFEGFLPSFVENQESQQVDNFDQSFDQHVTPLDVEEIVREEQEVLREERTLPKWVQKTLQDSKLDALLPRKTRAGTTFGREQVDLACFSTLCDADESDSFEQALECVQWKDAMQQEIDSIHKNHTWDLVDLPTGKKPIGTKWVFKVKRKQDDTVDRYKARLVAKSYAQQKGIDYDETFTPTSRASTVRSLVAIAAHHNWKVHQLDIKTAFLNGDLQEEVYVSQPSGFVVKGQEQKVCRLCKALYGLKQAPRAWYEKIHKNSCFFREQVAFSMLFGKKASAFPRRSHVGIASMHVNNIQGRLGSLYVSIMNN